MKNYTKKDYTLINSKTWDEWAKNGCDWTIPITHEAYVDARDNDNWGVYLTPCRFVPREWFGDLRKKRLLGLASGGAQQMPVFAARGAECTVFDFSDSQLEKESVTAEREGYQIQIIKGDMTKPLPFFDASFDIIFHPVSNCYIREVEPVWRECFRVLKPGGRLIAGFDNGLNFLLDGEQERLPYVMINKLPYDPLAMSDEEFASQRDHLNAIQFSHSLEEQLGGQLRAGFVLRDLYEDRDREGCGVLREFAPQYMATLAIKPINERM